MGATLTQQASLSVIKAITADGVVSSSVTLGSFMDVAADKQKVRGIKIFALGATVFINEKGLQTGTAVTATASISGYTHKIAADSYDTLPYGDKNTVGTANVDLITIIGSGATVSIIFYAES